MCVSWRCHVINPCGTKSSSNQLVWRNNIQSSAHVPHMDRVHKSKCQQMYDLRRVTPVWDLSRLVSTQLSGAWKRQLCLRWITDEVLIRAVGCFHLHLKRSENEQRLAPRRGVWSATWLVRFYSRSVKTSSDTCVWTFAHVSEAHAPLQVFFWWSFVL